MRTLLIQDCFAIAGGDGTNTTTTDTTDSTPTGITIPSITTPSITITTAEIDDLIGGVQDVAEMIEEQIHNSGGSHPHSGPHH